ncbi:MAG: DUF3179 domain-containing protein [Patescibacteria group bacterium]
MTQTQKQNLGLFVGAIVVIAGLTWAYNTYQSNKANGAAWPSLDGGVYASAVTRDGVASLVPNDQLYDSGVVEGGIPALTNPKYDSVLASDAVIADDLLGIDLDLGGTRRFYPVQIMNWHEVVNDTIDGKNIAITYCPLCGTGVVYDRDIDLSFDNFPSVGTHTFEATGKVYNNNTVMKDAETGSLWLQATGQSIQGTAIGRTLSVIPSQMMTWKVWKNLYPSGLVLSTNTGITRDYTRHPYGNYDTSKGVYFPINHTSPDFTSKWVTYGVTDGTNGSAFSALALSGTGMMTAELGDVPIIAIYNFETDTVRVFKTQSNNGDVHTFSFDFAKKRLTDNETGGVWYADGWSVKNNDEAHALVELPTVRGFWFCMAAMHPTWKAVATNE